MSVHKPITEADFQAREDARTLARASEISSDKKRVRLASTAAKAILKEEEDRVRGLRAVANKKPAKKKPAKKKPRRPKKR